MSNVRLTKRKIRNKRRYVKVSRFLFSPHASFWIVIAGAVLIILSIFAFTWQESFWSANSPLKGDKIGQFGDFVGGIVGSIWALAGVILFYVALNLQRKEFQLQRQELRETRNVFEKQAEQMRKQQREQTFFNLLNNHKTFVQSFTEKESDTQDNISGFQLINKKWATTKGHLILFTSSVKSKEVTISTTKLSPKNVLGTEKIYQSIFTYLTHVVEFIIRELDNDIFYHVTFYNNISNVEKLILGGYITYGLGYDNGKIDFHNLPFDYCKEFQSQNYFITPNGLPPSLFAKIIDHEQKLTVDHGADAMPLIKLAFNEGVQIQRVNIIYEVFMEESMDEEIIDYDTECHKRYQYILINPYNQINSHLFSGKIQTQISQNATSITQGSSSYLNFSLKVILLFNELEYTATIRFYYYANSSQPSPHVNKIYFYLRILE